MFLTGPALFMLDFRHYFMRRVNVKSSVRLGYLFRVGMRPVHDDVQMVVACVFMQGVESLMFGKSHSPEKKTDRLAHLFTGRLFVFLP